MTLTAPTHTESTSPLPPVSTPDSATPPELPTKGDEASDASLPTASGPLPGPYPNPAYFMAAAGIPPNAVVPPVLQSGGGPSTIIPSTSSASLYVGDLHHDVTESLLFEFFSQVGPVASIRICRDVVTRRSLGYAYVNFHNVQDAERALDTLNCHPIKGQPCRIMWSQRDPSLRRSGTGNIFIKNLDKSIDTKALLDTFSAFGNIISCKVVSDENGSKGFGYVHFETIEAADQAIEKVNGMLLNDKKVFVGPHIPRRERVSKLEEMKARFTNVYVKNLDLEVSNEEFKELFSPFGEITSFVVQRDAEGKSKGFGFVNYTTHDSANAAVNTMNNKEIREKPLMVCRAQSRDEREEELRRQHDAARMERLSKFNGVNLYVKNIDVELSDEALRTEFAAYGSVESCKIMRDERGISKGFGFVTFMQADEATKALAEVNGRLLASKPIYVALAQRKEDRRSALEALYAQRSQLRMMGGGMPMFYPGMYPGRSTGLPGQAPMMYPGPRVPRWAMNNSSMYGGGMQRQNPYYQTGPSQGTHQPSSPTSDNVANNGPGNVSNAGGGSGGMMAGMMMTPNGPMMAQPQMMRPSRPSGGPYGRSGRGGMPSYSNNGPMGMGGYGPRSFNGQNVGGYGGMTSSSGFPPSAAYMPRRGGYNSGGGGGMSGGRGGPMMSRGGGGYRGGPGDFYNMYGGGPSSGMMPSMMSGGLTATSLASAPPEAQKQMLGERLYPLVYAQEPSFASKITGMLLDMDNGELLHLLESPESLTGKVSEALSLLQPPPQQQQQQITSLESLQTKVTPA